MCNKKGEDFTPRPFYMRGEKETPLFSLLLYW
jgi:hypothetical protein